MKVDGSILVDNPSAAGNLAKRLEDVGYAGAFTFEGRHDPFLPLCIAAERTTKLELITAVAVAFARNPMLLANLGYDLQLQSKGRFILGLGSQIRAHIVKRYGMPWSHPAARMREFVLALRAIWANWQDGTPLHFAGEFYTHTLMTPVFNPGPNPFGLPKIFVAGVGPKMTEVAAEVGDGFMLHPFHTDAFLREHTRPALEKGLTKAGRKRADFEISCEVIIAAGDTEDELVNAMNGARAQISFYASTPAYRPVLDSIGMGALQEELRELSKTGKWLDMAGRIDDELLEQIAVIGSLGEIANKIRARYAGFADRVSLVAPFAPDPKLWSNIVNDLKQSDG